MTTHTATDQPAHTATGRTRDELVQITADLLAAVDNAAAAGQHYPADRYGLAWCALTRDLRALCARHRLPLPAGLVTGEPSEAGYPYGATA